jgi:acyl-CoA synthetase (AMP-forming)/AMP-acid ligase II
VAERDTASMLRSAGTLPGILAHRLAAHPEDVAVVLATERGDQPLSVRALLEGAASYAAAYRDAGVRADDVVLNLLPPGADLLYGFLGAMLLGGVPSILPFPTERLDAVLYRENLVRLMKITKPAALVAEAAFGAELREKLAPDARAAILELGLGGRFAGAPADVQNWEGLSRSADAVALLQHSSGTTGLQKGVALSHRAIVNQLAAYLPAVRLTTDDVIVSWLPLYHDMGLIAGFLLPLLSGAKLVLMSPFEWVRAPWKLLRAVATYRGTVTWLPNFAYNFCAQKIPDEFLQDVDLSSWRAVINCSEPMYAESHHLFQERFAPYGLRPDALGTCYAMAENVFAVTQGGIGIPVTLDRVDAEELENARRATPARPESRRVVESVSAGPPLPNCEVRVVGDDLLPLADRQVGELALRSDCMLTGYYNRPDVTKEAIRDGWYLTGDLGYMADGEVYITGRKKDLMIIAGRNVYPQDLEYIINRVSGVHPGRSVVFGLSNPKLGTEEVAAVVEVDQGEVADPRRLTLAFRHAVAAGSDVVLRHVKLVDERWLIKTSSGKIARGSNREKFLSQTGS